MRDEMLERIRAAIESGSAGDHGGHPGDDHEGENASDRNGVHAGVHAGDPAGGHAGADAEATAASPELFAGSRLVASGLDRDERIALFRERAASQGATVHVVGDRVTLKDTIGRILTAEANSQPTVAVAVDQRLERALAGGGEELLPEVCTALVPDDGDQDALFRLDAALTGVDLAVAETGSVLLLAGARAPRRASLVAPVHVAFVFPDQIVADLVDLGDALARIGGAGTSAGGATLVTGPSKTADIEIRLVTGVHGPGSVHLIVLDGFERD